MRSVTCGWALSAVAVVALAGVTVPTTESWAAAPDNGPVPMVPVDPDEFAHDPSTVIVGFQPGASPAARSVVVAAAGAVSTEPLTPLDDDTRVLHLPNGRSVAAALDALRRNPNVRFAEPDYVLTATLVSNDPYVVDGTTWGMYGDASTPSNQFGSQAAEAWATGEVGSSDRYVVVIDEGFDVNHLDLVGNTWTNPFDPVNGVDDDSNGFIDDAHGWDFVGNDASVFDGTADDHGTHVAGTIGGVGGNGIGVAGVNWDVTLISAKFLGTSGGSTVNAVRAVDYATDLKVRHGLDVVATNNSWGGGGYSQSLQDAINRGGDAGILFVAAAGNSSSNNDTTAYYPSGYQCTTTAASASRGWDCVVSVAAIASTGAKSDFSSVGATTVDLGAPGSAIQSTLPFDNYGSYSGTSMATPHVTGAIALCSSANPSLSARELRTLLLDSVAPTASLAGVTVTGGRLDVGSLVSRCAATPSPLVGGPSEVTAAGVTPTSIRVDWSDGSSNEAFSEVQLSAAGCASFAPVATVGSNVTSTVVNGLTPSTEYCFRVRAGNTYLVGGVPNVSSWSNAANGSTLDPPTAYRCSAVAFSWIDPSAGSAMTQADDSSVQIDIGFSFPFYGTSYSAVSVGSNGLLGFGGPVNDYANTTLPSTNAPNGLAAVFWDDLSPNLGGSVKYLRSGTAPNRTLVISWVDVPQYSVVGSAVTFQVVLDEASGSFTYQYLDVVIGDPSYDRGASATIGTETPDGAFGTLVSYNRATLVDRTALRCDRVATTAPTVSTTALPVGHTRSPYAAGLSVLGGTAPYTWSLTGGTLPAGLSLATASGLVSGTPSIEGSSTVSVSVTDAQGRTSSAPVSIVIDAGVSVATSVLPGAGVAAAYSTTLSASGGTAPYSWSATGLPAGMSLSTSGVLSGTPSEAGTSTVTITVNDGSSPVLTATRQLSLVVTAAPVITTSTLAASTLDVALSSTLAVSAGTAPYSWTVVGGALPPGVSLSAGGVVSGVPTSVGSFGFTARVTDALSRSDDQLLTLVVLAPLTVSTSTLPLSGVGLPYSATLAATGGSGAYTWTSGTLPAGLSLSTSGVLSGTPTATGAPTVQFTVTDGGGRTASASLVLSVTAAPAVTTSALAAAGSSIAYSYTLTSSGGAGTRTWSVVSGAFPPGATLSSSGVLSGTTSVTGTTWFTVRVTDGLGRTADRTLSLQVLAPVTVAAPSLSQATVGVSVTSSLVASGGTGAYTWSVSGLPPGLAVGLSTGAITGTPVATGTYTVVATATDAGMPAASGARAWTVVVANPVSISTTSLPTASKGSAYSTTLSASGGSGALTWTLSAGSLPSGLAVSSTGVLSGTPTVSGTFTPTFRAADAFGRSTTKALTLSVVASTTIKVSSLTIVKSITSTGAVGTVTATVVNGVGSPVGSVTVAGAFTVSGVTGSSAKSSTTSTSGVATIKSNAYKSITGRTLTFCISSLSRTGYTFDRTGPTCVSIVI